MSARAGIVVTGTEVLSGIIPDRNGPWLAERLRERGVQLAHVVIVGDRPGDLRAALDFLARERMDVILTSGGLGPTADDLTAEVVAEFAGPRDAPRRGAGGPDRGDPRAAARALARRDRRGGDAGGQPQAGDGARGRDGARARRDRAGPRRARGRRDGGRAARARPASCSRCGRGARDRARCRPRWPAPGVYEQRIMRLFGPPESEIAKTLRDAEADGVALDRLEITTCLRRGEIEIATVFEPDAEARLRRLRGRRARAPRRDACSPRDGETIDELVAAALLGPPVRTVAVAESCTGGLMAGRLTDRAGSSAYVLGGADRVLQRGEGRARGRRRRR